MQVKYLIVIWFWMALLLGEVLLKPFIAGCLGRCYWVLPIFVFFSFFRKSTCTYISTGLLTIRNIFPPSLTALRSCLIRILPMEQEQRWGKFIERSVKGEERFFSFPVFIPPGWDADMMDAAGAVILNVKWTWEQRPCVAEDQVRRSMGPQAGKQLTTWDRPCRCVHDGEIDFYVSPDTVIPNFLPCARESNTDNTPVNLAFWEIGECGEAGEGQFWRCWQ